MTGEEEPQAPFGDIASALAEMPYNTVPEEGSKARAVVSRMGTIYARQKKHKSVTIHSDLSTVDRCSHAARVHTPLYTAAGCAWLCLARPLRAPHPEPRHPRRNAATRELKSATRANYPLYNRCLRMTTRSL